MSELPKDDTPVIGVFENIVRYKRYSTASNQFKSGVVGRWQRFNGYGWDNCEEPNSWSDKQ